LELQLPPTELHHKASLVCLSDLSSDGMSSKFSLLVVSPEGNIRFWPDISKPQIFNEVNMSLAGKLCHSASSLQVS